MALPITDTLAHRLKELGECLEAFERDGDAGSLRMSGAGCKRWVAVERSRIVGFCEHSFDGMLSRIYVHKDRLGTGIGTRLLQRRHHILELRGQRAHLLGIGGGGRLQLGDLLIEQIGLGIEGVDIAARECRLHHGHDLVEIAENETADS